MSFLTRNRLPLCWQTALRWFSLNLGLFFVFGASQIFVLCIFYQTGPQRIFFFFSHFVLCFDDVNSDLVTAVKQHCLKVQRHFEITMFGATQLVVNFLTSTAKKYLFLLISAGCGRDGILSHSELYIYQGQLYLFCMFKRCFGYIFFRPSHYVIKASCFETVKVCFLISFTVFANSFLFSPICNDEWIYLRLSVQMSNKEAYHHNITA